MDLQKKQEYFKNFYEKEADRIFRFIIFRVGNKEDALDITSEVFYKFWQVILNENKVYNEFSLIFTIARNMIVDWYRRKRPISLDSMLEASEELGINFEPMDESALREMNISVEASWVMQVVSKLLPQYKEVIMMRFVEDLSIKEIAEILSITENAVSLRINQGLKKIREKLDITKKNSNV